MSTSRPLPTIQETPRIGLIGDVHGELGPLISIARSMAERDIRTLLVLGDFGVLWPGSNWQRDIQQLSRRLSTLGQVLHFVDGNHEDHDRLVAFPVAADGLRRVTPNIIHVPRGYRTTLTSGRTLAALGGANSIDRYQRSDAIWWAAEAITDADLTELGPEHADILVGHDAPLDLLSLDRGLAKGNHLWPAKALAYARHGREMLHRGLLQTAPELYLGGHYHRHIDEVAGYMTDNRGFATRTVLLDMIETQGTASTAVLDVDTLDLDFFSTSGAALPSERSQVTDLTAQDHGRWLLHTIGSRHIIDLDARTVERLPGPNTRATTSDRLHHLRTLDLCRIGDVGFWTMLGDEFVDYYWHRSSVIRHIEIVPVENGPADAHLGEADAP